MIRSAVFLSAVLALSAHLCAQDMPKDYQEVLSSLGKKGDFKDEVLKVSLPRNDLKVTVAGVIQALRLKNNKKGGRTAALRVFRSA